LEFWFFVDGKQKAAATAGHVSERTGSAGFCESASAFKEKGATERFGSFARQMIL